MNAQITFPEMETMKADLNELRMAFSLLLERTKANQTVNISDIARMEGTSVSQLRKGGAERYLLPRFGVSEYPDGKVRWSWETYEKWRKIPVEERKLAYRKYLLEEMKRNNTRA